MRFDGSRWPTPSRQAERPAAPHDRPHDLAEVLERLAAMSTELAVLRLYLDDLYKRTGARDRMQLAQGTIPDA